MEYHTKHSITLHAHYKLQLALGISGGSRGVSVVKPPFGLYLKDLINNLAN